MSRVKPPTRLDWIVAAICWANGYTYLGLLLSGSGGAALIVGAGVMFTFGGWQLASCVARMEATR